jgi:hypothetical protein
MVFYNTYQTKCPGCGKNFGGGISKVYWIPVKAGLGPEQVRCPKCGQIIATGLIEWQHMTAGQKIRFGILSIINSVVGSFLPALGTFFVIGRFYPLPDSGDLSNRVMLGGVMVYSAILLCCQLMRVELSNRRVEEPGTEPMKASYSNWQTNFQFIILMANLGGLGLMILAMVVK